jgi:hypothetical protein
MKTGSCVIVFFILFSCIQGCKGPGADVLPLDKMKVVFLHHMMVEEMLNNYQRRDTTLNFDSVQSVSYRNILLLHNIDSAVFYKSLAYYKSDIERFTLLVDSANALGVREREKRYELDAEAAEKKAEQEMKATEDSLATRPDSLSSKPDSLTSRPDSLARVSEISGN